MDCRGSLRSLAMTGTPFLSSVIAIRKHLATCCLSASYPPPGSKPAVIAIRKHLATCCLSASYPPPMDESAVIAIRKYLATCCLSASYPPPGSKPAVRAPQGRGNPVRSTPRHPARLSASSRAPTRDLACLVKLLRPAFEASAAVEMRFGDMYPCADFMKSFIIFQE